MDKFQVAFLDTREFENRKCIRGAVLVTDAATEPIEFRCTSAIRPTLLRTTLWGGRLAGYLASQLVGKPLLSALSNKVSIVIVRKPEFVEVRPLIQAPLIQLLRNEELTMASPLTLESAGDEVLESAAGRFEPVVVKVHRQHPDDRKVARELLAEAFRSHNLLEPFERIANALELVHQQEATQQGR